MGQGKILRGGADLERLYLYDWETHEIRISKSDLPAVEDMGEVILRHIGRYGFALPFIKPGYRILDFPCGSGLFCEILNIFFKLGEIEYNGFDSDLPTIQYAKHFYGKNHRTIKFEAADLTTHRAPIQNYYDIICCIEGIEHIEQKYQAFACEQFYKALKPGGTFIISSPEPESGKSGPNPNNPFHLWEMTLSDFTSLLNQFFKKEDIAVTTQTNSLSTGQKIKTHYAVCHKTQ